MLANLYVIARLHCTILFASLNFSSVKISPSLEYMLVNVLEISLFNQSKQIKDIMVWETK